MAETIRQRLVRSYSYNVYIDGSRTLSSVGSSYHVEIKTYAAINFSDIQLGNALSKGWITQQEYDDTMLIKYPEGKPVVAEDSPQTE